MIPSEHAVFGTAGMTRRALLTRSLAFGTGGLWLAACSGVVRQQPGGPQAQPTTNAVARATAGPRRGGTLHVSQPDDISPAVAPFVLAPVNTQLYNLVYDTLVRYDAQLNPQPRLATSWEWSPDFLQLTLKLRPGVKFHTGRPFTSADARFNLERLSDPAVNSQWLNYAKVMHVETPDPGTLLVRYDAPVRSSFDALSAAFMADPQTLDQTRDGRGFVGTGPFRFKEWMPNDHVTVVRDPDYWQPGKPYVDEVQVKIAPDAQSALINLESSGLDWMSGVPAPDARRLQNDAAYQLVLNGTGGSLYYLGLDVGIPALADKRVRQAFAYALDRQRIVETALLGFARPASIPWPRQSSAYDAALDRTYSFDLTKARGLRAAAGWDPNTTVGLSLSSAYPPTQPMAEILQQDLASIGIKVAIQKLEAPEFTSRLQKGALGGAWLANMSFMHLSPATFFISAFPVRLPNSSHFESPRYKELIDQSYAETDDQKLKPRLREMTQIMLDEAFVVPIAEPSSGASGPQVTRAGVKNVTWDDWGWFIYEDIWLER